MCTVALAQRCSQAPRHVCTRAPLSGYRTRPNPRAAALPEDRTRSGSNSQDLWVETSREAVAHPPHSPFRALGEQPGGRLPTPTETAVEAAPTGHIDTTRTELDPHPQRRARPLARHRRMLLTVGSRGSAGSQAQRFRTRWRPSGCAGGAESWGWGEVQARDVMGSSGGPGLQATTWAPRAANARTATARATRAGASGPAPWAASSRVQQHRSPRQQHNVQPRPRDEGEPGSKRSR